MKCQLSPDGKQVFLEIDPKNKACHGLTEVDIYELLEESGYGHYRVFHSAILDLVKKDLSKLPQPTSILIAEKPESGIVVSISEDEMEAAIKVPPAQEGETPITVASLRAALAKAGVTHGIQDDVLEICVLEGQLNQSTVVARGTPVQNGLPPTFEYLVPEEEPDNPELHEDEQGRIDYFERNLIKTVQPNDPLMRRHPPTPGEDGLTVTGVPIYADKAKNIMLEASTGSAISSEDSSLLIATRAGKPIRKSNSVKVDEMITVDEVGIESGNVRFGGSIVVKGNVNSGFEVEAGGDIIVMGTVEGATLKAGGSIKLTGSFFGHGQGHLMAQQDITAQFIQNAEIDCNGYLMVSDGLYHCNARSGKSILAGINGGKGHINGGKLSAVKLIKARLIGSASSTACQLYVGVQPKHREQLAELEKERQNLNTRLEEAVKSLIYIRTKAMAEKGHEMPEIEAKRNEINVQLSELNIQINNLKSVLESRLPVGRIMATHQLFSGVKITIGETKRSIDEDLDSCLFSLHQTRNGAEIELGSLHKNDFEFQLP